MSINIVKDSIDIGLVTGNIDAMTTFYRDILGLEVESTLELPGGGQMTRLLCGTTVIKLVVQGQTPQASNPPGGLAGATGIRYFTIHVDNLAEAVGECQAAGCSIPVAGMEFRPGVTIAMIEDPDGNWVELVQFG